MLEISMSTVEEVADWCGGDDDDDGAKADVLLYKEKKAILHLMYCVWHATR